MACHKKGLIFENSHKGLNEFIFSHDKIQLACINQSQFDKEETNVIIGRKFQEESVNTVDNEVKAKIIYHLNQGKSKLSLIEQKELINLNFEFGIYQLKKLYGKSATNYFSNALELYEQTNSTNQDILFDIYISKIKSLQLNSQFEKALTLLDKINHLFNDKQKKQQFILTKMNIHITQSNYKKVLDIGISTLNKHQYFLKECNRITTCIYKAVVTLAQLLFSLKKLNSKNISEDKEIIFLSKVFFELIGPAYFVNKKIYISIICDFLRFSLKKGITKETSFTLLLFTKIILVGIAPFKLVKYLNSISFKLLEEFDNQVIKVNSLLVYNIFISRFYIPLHKNIQEFEKNIEQSVKSTDIIYLAYAIATCPIFIIADGKNLKFLDSFVNKNERFINELKYPDAKYKIEIIKWYLNSIRHQNQIQFNNQEIINTILNNQLLMPSSLYLYLQIHRFYLNKDFKKAISFAKENQSIFKNVMGLIQIEEANLYLALSILENQKKNKSKLSLFEKQSIRKTKKLFKKYARQNKENYLVKYLLLIGTIQQVNNKKAIHYFRKMLDESNKLNKPLLQAISHEKVAECCNDVNLSNHHYNESKKFFQSWSE